MPGLRLCGQRWPLSTDDFLYPSIFSLATHTTYLIPGAILFHTTLSSPSASTSARLSACKATWHSSDWPLFVTWAFSNVVLPSLSLALSLLLVRYSLSGPVLDPHAARSPVPSLLAAQTLLGLLEVGAAGLGVYVVWASSLLSCESLPAHLAAALNATLALQCAMLLLSALCCGGVYLCLGGRSASPSPGTTYQSRWVRRVKVLACAARGTQGYEDDIYGSAPAVLHKIFVGIEGGDSYDVVPSDIAAGLVALARDQRAVGVGIELDVDDSIPNPLPTLPQEERQALLEDAAAYGPYSFAAYGWPLWALTRLMACTRCGPCSLLPCCCCCCAYGRADAGSFELGIVGDNMCGYNAHGLLASLPPHLRHSARVLHANFRNALFQPAFLVAVNEETSSVIIAIRGTLSLEDTLTDAVASAVPLPDEFEFHTPGYVHDGMARAASWVYSQLFGPDGGEGHVQGLNAAVRSALGAFGEQGRLVVVGHSLGAGTASLLALRLHAEFASILTCFAYSCPAVMTLPLARACADFICTPLLGHDIVPRLSVRNVFELRENMMHALRHEPGNKHALFCGCAPITSSQRQSHGSAGGPGNASETTTLLAAGSVNPGQVGVVTLSGAQDGRPVPLRRASVEDPVIFPGMNDADLIPLATPLYPPGHILQVVKHKSQGRQRERRVEAAFVDPASLDKVLASGTMFTDHMPWLVFNALSNATLSHP